ncbi:MAG: extracellular solute-binding protein [Myxococcota bacterium]
MIWRSFLAWVLPFAMTYAFVDLSPAKAQELRLWHAYDGAEAEGLEAACRAFEAAHPGVRVDTVGSPFGAYAARLETAIPAGVGPDVFIDAHERLSDFVPAGLVEPYGAIGLGTRLDAGTESLEVLSLDGTLYGLPLALKSAALYINNDLHPEPVGSIEALLARSYPEGVVPLAFEAESSYYVAALVHAYGGALFTPERGFALHEREAAAAVRALAGWVEQGTVPEETNGDLVKQLFRRGQAAAVISGPWLAGSFPDDLDYRVEPLPRVEGAGGARMRPFLTIEGAYVAAGAREPELARELIEFLATEGAMVRATEGRQVVASRSAFARLEGDAFLTRFRDASVTAVPMPQHPEMRATFEPAQRALRKILRGDAEIEAALLEARRRFDDVTREGPPERKGNVDLIVAGALLLLLTLWMLQRARRDRAHIARSLPAYRYLWHAALAVGLLVIGPLIVGAVTSLFSGRGRDLYYVGWANYTEILTARGGDLWASGSFWSVLLVTVIWTALNVFFHVLIGVALALLLHRYTGKLRPIYRVALILPWAVPSYVTAITWKGMFHRQFGAINAILEALGAEPVSWFAEWSTAFAANVATNVWLGFPFMMVVTLGGLAAIPEDLYEAAKVDGANAVQRFRRITWPLLRPVLGPAVAMGAVWTFNMFNVVFLVSGGEPDGSTEILVSEAYRWAFTRSSQYGYAAAYAVLIFGLLLLGTRRFAGRLDGMGASR